VDGLDAGDCVFDVEMIAATDRFEKGALVAVPRGHWMIRKQRGTRAFATPFEFVRYGSNWIAASHGFFSTTADPLCGLFAGNFRTFLAGF
jgi:hypothetical protein